MPQSLAQVWLHLVFSTKDRKPLLHDPQFRDEMHRMLSHHVQEAGCFPKLTGGWIDHVHILCGLSRTVRICDLIEQVKTETSKWSKTKPNGSKNFSWQSGYGAFSVSQSNLSQTIRYIEQQETHHTKQSFQDEFRQLCRLHEIEVDER